MAKKDAKGEAKGGGGGFIGLIVVTVLALACGAGFGFFLDSQMKSAAVAKAADTAEEPAKAEEPKPAVSPSARLVALTPIVANLAEPRNAWMRVEASILVEGMVQGADALAAQLAEDILAYLRTTKLSQFEGPSGFQNLREDFRDRATIRDAEHIKDVIIHGVVVE